MGISTGALQIKWGFSPACSTRRTTHAPLRCMAAPPRDYPPPGAPVKRIQNGSISYMRTQMNTELIQTSAKERHLRQNFAHTTKMISLLPWVCFRGEELFQPKARPTSPAAVLAPVPVVVEHARVEHAAQQTNTQTPVWWLVPPPLSVAPPQAAPAPPSQRPMCQCVCTRGTGTVSLSCVRVWQ
jgi:hypothetical protein